jgi:hypothetical protein
MSRNSRLAVAALLIAVVAGGACADPLTVSARGSKSPTTHRPLAQMCGLDTKSCLGLWNRPATLCLVDTKYCPQDARLADAFVTVRNR